MTHWQLQKQPQKQKKVDERLIAQLAEQGLPQEKSPNKSKDHSRNQKENTTHWQLQKQPQKQQKIDEKLIDQPQQLVAQTAPKDCTLLENLFKPKWDNLYDVAVLLKEATYPANNSAKIAHRIEALGMQWAVLAYKLTSLALAHIANPDRGDPEQKPLLTDSNNTTNTIIAGKWWDNPMLL